jgi:hypothetical protein
LDSDKRVFSFTDAEQKLCYLWNEQGNAILPTPIETDQIPALQYRRQNEEIKIYWTVDDAIKSTSLHWPN